MPKRSVDGIGLMESGIGLMESEPGRTALKSSAMTSRDQVCIINNCRNKSKKDVRELKVNIDQFLDKLEIKPDKFDNARNIFVCFRHLHPMTNKKENCEQFWFKHNSLPDRFVVGHRGVPKTYNLSKYRQLQKRLQKLTPQDHDQVQKSFSFYFLLQTQNLTDP